MTAHDAHPHHHGHAHGHHHDRGARAALRYLRLLPRLWRSEVNDAVVEQLAPRPGELVVDLGAGMGAATITAARRGAKVIAVDPMPLMRTMIGLRRLRHGWFKQVSVLDGAAEAIPAGDHSVDAVWTVNTLHHWTDRASAARELARVLRPGGRALLVDEDFDDPSHPEHAQISARRRQSGRMFDEVDPEELAGTLKSAGFAQAEASRTRLAGRPVKLIRATR